MTFGAAFNLETLNGTNGFLLQGLSQGVTPEILVSDAGDINNDGIADFILGVPFGDSNGVLNAGISYVVFGGSQLGQTGSLTPDSLDGTNGFAIAGIDTNDRAGSAISSAGDVNNDGLDDLLIGAPTARRNQQNFAGESYVVFGRTQGFSPQLNLADLDGSNGFIINGPSIDDDQVGASVSELGDINGDDIDDFIIGAPRTRPDDDRSRAGASYVVFGGSGLGSSGQLALTSLNGSNGFVIEGIAPTDRSGAVVSSAGDINGDGINDILIAAPDVNAEDDLSGEEGEAYVVFGGSGVGGGGTLQLADLNGANGFVIEAVDEGSSLGGLGLAISPAGDLNGDGIDDILVADPSADIEGIGGTVGRVHVLFGDSAIGSSGRFDLADLDGTNGFVINGISSIDEWGSSVSALGDLNGDGLDDIILAPDLGAGYYVIYGSPTLGQGGSLNLSDVDGSNGFFIFEISDSRIIGGVVSGVGDINNDGINDLLTTSDTLGSLAQAYAVFGDAGDASPSDGQAALGFFDYEQFLRFQNPSAVAPSDTIDGLPLAQLFDEQYYLVQNPDVAAAVASGAFSAGYQHFVQFGVAEGRDPSILYNEQHYLDTNVDVAQAIQNGGIRSGLEHFLVFGHEEGRDPSSLFSQQDYLTNNPDVAAAVNSGGFQSGFEHYIEFGAGESRLPILSLYDEIHYLQNNPDVAAAVTAGAFTDGFEHFVLFGQGEGRTPSTLYNESSYLGFNPDVAAAVAAGAFANGFEHYIEFGRFEDRAVL